MLGKERSALRALLFRLHETRSLSVSSTELDESAAGVRAADAEREAVLACLVATDGVRGTSLRAIARTAHEPFASMLEEHRTELRRLSAEIAGAVRDLEAGGVQPDALKALRLPSLKSFLR